MWLILNPKKGHRFTTKGINLHKSAPTAFVDPGTDGETMTAINQAITDGRIIRVAGNKMDEMSIPQQAKMSSINTEDIKTKARIEHVKDTNGKILSTIIVMPDEDGNVIDAPIKEQGVILTGITETDRDEDDGED